MFKSLSEFTTGRHIPDINSGFRVFRRSEVIPFYPNISSGFSFTTTVTLAYMLNDLTVHYMPIPYHRRTGSSKVRYFRDTLRSLQIIVEAILQYNPLKIFLLMAFSFLLLTVLLAGSAIGFSSTVIGLGSLLSLCTASVLLALGFVSVLFLQRSSSQHNQAAQEMTSFQRFTPMTVPARSTTTNEVVQ